MSHYRNGKNGGHVGGHVRNRFLNAVDAYLAWESGEPEPMVDFEVRFVARPIPIASACSVVWNCSDILPSGAVDALDQCGIELNRRTYAAAARALSAAINAPLPKDRRYPIIYADPPWQYDHMISVSREIENQYPTMSIDDICEMDVESMTTADAMLFLWVPPSFLHKGVRVIEAWGFNYLTSAVWDKRKMGMGYYFRQQHEHVLLGFRGKAIVPDPSSLSPSVVAVERGEHSTKPDEFYEIIERMYPSLPKIELFSRRPRDGWSAWGNQAEQEAA